MNCREFLIPDGMACIEIDRNTGKRHNRLPLFVDAWIKGVRAELGDDRPLHAAIEVENGVPILRVGWQ